MAAELERRGWTAAVPLSNTKDFDILAINRSTHKQVSIQVKTTQYSLKKWVLTKNCETLSAPHIKYVFVALNDLATPEYHIVPSEHVARTVSEDHRNWLARPGIKAQPHKDNGIRNFWDKGNKFRNRWELLDETDPSE